jgi:hypothetical protein
VDAADLLADLRRQGFRLTAEGAGIRVSPSSRLPGELRRVILAHKAGLLALLRPAVPPWDQAEAGRLLAELRAQVGRIEAVDFGGRPPEALRNILADSLAIGQGYTDNHAAEADRGWDALELLRGLRNRVHQYAVNAKRLATNPEGR